MNHVLCFHSIASEYLEAFVHEQFSLEKLF